MTFSASDIPYGFRRLRHARGFSLFSIATLAIGIGATTAIYSVIQATLYQPLPFAEPDRVVNIYGNDFAGQTSGRRYQLSLPDFDDLRTQQTTFTDVLAWGRMRATWSTSGQTVVTFGEAVTGNYFTVLGVRPPITRRPRTSARGDSPHVASLVFAVQPYWHTVPLIRE
jgi:putative ABC transport system permease protein